MYKKFIRPLLFDRDAEDVHNFTLGMLSKTWVTKLIKMTVKPGNNIKLHRKIGKLTYRNPIGLAAGMDKNAVALPSWEAMGFGFAEVGTITPVSQNGNPKPRMFRLPEYNSIINRLGFNNIGMDELYKNISAGREKISDDFIVGVNIGKSSKTDLKNAFDDYRLSFEKLFEQADYFTINVSSPNTEGLRELQHKEYLDWILTVLQKLNLQLDEVYPGGTKDIFLKIAPDLTDAELDDIIEVSIENNITGIIATNTTISREMLPKGKYETGGLSGAPLRARSSEVVSYIKQKAGDKLAIIGCGGIFDVNDVKEKFDCGADLVQLYTGLVYEGPFFVKRLIKELLKSESYLK